MSNHDNLKPRRQIAWRLVKVIGLIILILVMLSIGGIVYYFATLYTIAERQEGYLALVGATVLAGENLEPQQGITVLIHDGIIVQIAEEANINLPPDTPIIDLSGYILMPGMMDLHVHLGAPELEAGQEFHITQLPGLLFDVMRYVPNKRRAFLEHGVTTIRSVGDEYSWVMEMRQMLQDGELEGPRLFAAGPVFTNIHGHPVTTIGVDADSDGIRAPTTPEEARLMVQELAIGDDRVDLIKVVQDRGSPERPLAPIVPDVLNAIVDEAHKHDLRVFAHWNTLEDLEDLLAANVDGLEHVGRVLEGWNPALLTELIERDISMTPTLAVFEVADLPSSVMPALMRQVEEFHTAGGRVVAGTDAGMPGVPAGSGVHRELELLVDSGLSPQEALIAATSQAAHVLEVDHIGAIMPEYAADLVVIDGNPLEDIRTIRNVVMVFRDGRLVFDQRNTE